MKKNEENAYVLTFAFFFLIQFKKDKKKKSKHLPLMPNCVLKIHFKCKLKF